MEIEVLGWPPDGPTLRLDYRRFSYAGKFVMSNTGKAVVREPNAATDSEWDDAVLAAVAFNEDRTDPSTLWLRYVTVRDDLRGEGLGPRLCRFVSDRAAERGYDRVRIGVNNPYAYEALYRAGFAFTGEDTGVAELVLERPTSQVAPDRSAETYQAGLDRYRERDLSDAEVAFLARKTGSEPPTAAAADPER
ncbi:GNAT family N-acetyltransferase [Natronomonas salina]|uniref:GNAT family N-acetyltransferase n=1 Tax=Natronomonas salina TaxID=1710540 RepID=UPI0015B3ACA8|nr:GNAT family N-acetyltransferase [Natronomonas salina]QLD88076.1 GNAT family N-acetyltransferase [Natronomonas salina]